MASSEAPNDRSDVAERLTPQLRRFARALLAGRGDAAAADQLVQNALGHVGPGAASVVSTVKIALYAGVVQAHRNRHSTYGPSAEPGKRPRGNGGVARAIERLPLDQREVILLVALEQLSYEEVAAILGLPRSAILARLMRARGSLAATDADLPHRPAHLHLVK